MMDEARSVANALVVAEADSLVERPESGAPIDESEELDSSSGVGSAVETTESVRLVNAT